MPATAADIAAATRDAAFATWQDGAIRTRFLRARDGSTDGGAPGYCDNLADAQALADARGVLIGAPRRRFVVRVQDLLWQLADPATGGVPTVRLIDAEHSVDADALVTRVELDLEQEMTVLEVWA